MIGGADGKTPAAAAGANGSALDSLVSALRAQHGSAVNTILFYGSCLRAGNPFDGIVDLYLVADSYRDFYGSGGRAFANWLLPPNVFYKEFAIADQTVRVKYNVLSSADLRRGLSGRWMHSYLWGRFSQPVEILWCRDAGLRTEVENSLLQAAITFLDRVLPVVAATGTVRDLWRQGLQLSYAAELRSEGPGRAQELVDHALAHYVAASKAGAPAVRHALRISGDGDASTYTAAVPARTRLAGRWAWAIRRLQGKFLSVARLLKAFFTFEGGLDYAAWKLGRHSGQPVEIPDRVRRHPLIFVWPLLWKLYRRGVLR